MRVISKLVQPERELLIRQTIRKKTIGSRFPVANTTIVVVSKPFHLRGFKDAGLTKADLIVSFDHSHGVNNLNLTRTAISVEVSTNSIEKVYED